MDTAIFTARSPSPMTCRSRPQEAQSAARTRPNAGATMKIKRRDTRGSPRCWPGHASPSSHIRSQSSRARVWCGRPQNRLCRPTEQAFAHGGASIHGNAPAPEPRGSERLDLASGARVARVVWATTTSRQTKQPNGSRMAICQFAGIKLRKRRSGSVTSFESPQPRIGGMPGLACSPLIWRFSGLLQYVFGHL